MKRYSTDNVLLIVFIGIALTGFVACMNSGERQKKTEALSKGDSDVFVADWETGSKPVLKNIDRGIQIIAPREGDVHRRGTTIEVTFRVTTWRETESGSIRFTLHPWANPALAAVATLEFPYTHHAGDHIGPLIHQRWTLPPTLPFNDSYIIVARLSNTIWGQSDSFSVLFLGEEPVITGLAGENENNIHVLFPIGNEVYRPGDLVPGCWIFNDHELTPPYTVEAKIWQDCEAYILPHEWPIESGNPNLPGSEFTMRIPDTAQEAIYCLAIEAGVSGVNYGKSHIFFVRRPNPYGTPPELLGPAKLEVIAPGFSREVWDRHHSHYFRWRFHSGFEGVIPGTWVIDLLHWDPAYGYSSAYSFSPAFSEVSQVNERGRIWWEYSTAWNIPSDLEDGEYKFRIRGLDFESESLNFSITGPSAQVNFRLDGLSRSMGNLIAHIDNQRGNFDGRIEVLVETKDPLDSESVLASQLVTVFMTVAGGEFDLGTLRYLVGDLSDFDCGIRFRVNLDPNNLIDEANESDNTLEDVVLPPIRDLRMEVRDTFSGELLSGPTWTISRSQITRERLGILIKKCGAINPERFWSNIQTVRVIQTGGDLGTDRLELLSTTFGLSGSPPSSDFIILPGSIVEDASSSVIHIYYENSDGHVIDDIAPNPRTLQVTFTE